MSAHPQEPSGPGARGLGLPSVLAGTGGPLHRPEPGTSHAEFALCAHGLTSGWDGGEPAIEAIDLEIPYGSSVALLGPNGSGKSSLFAAAVGLIEPWAGTIGIGTRGVALLPQQLSVAPGFPVTARDVVEMGRWASPVEGKEGWRRWLRRLDSTDRDRIDEAMSELGVAELGSKRFAALSGGQRQRVLLAQILVQDAGLILLDEPHSGVDRPSAEIIDRLIAEWGSRGAAVVVATHDLDAAASDYELVVALNRRVVAFGPAAEVCTEPVLRETFTGHVTRLADSELVDTSHRHPGAG